jgi:SAM-dependent methyltransferase
MVVDNFMEQQEYRDFYSLQSQRAVQYWKETDRKDFEADLWYNRNRNEIGINMIAEICRGKKVLSVGGGEWVETEFLEKLPVKELVRTDLIDAEGIKVADAAALPFEDNSFDVVICREVIEHVIETDPVLDEAHRVLKDGGYYFISTPNGYNTFPDGKLHRRAYTPESFIKELKLHGFEVVDKRGDVPNILHSLLSLSNLGFKNVLEEFKNIEAMMRISPISYYVGTFMYVLAKKVSV